MYGVSVVVCCHNSAARIGPTLEHLARQRPRCAWEVIVVDNGSCDDTVAVAGLTWQEHGSPAPLRVVSEPQLGLTFARACGISEAQHEYVVFCDDDNWLDADYLQQAVEIIDSEPEIGALGGICRAASDAEIPAWFWSYAHEYAVGAQALESGDITSRRLLWGAGMVLRRSAIQHIMAEGVRTLLTDRRGTELTTGGDSEICKWLILAGYRLWYDERLKLTHFIRPDRLTKEHCQRLRAANDAAGGLLKPYQFVIDAATTSSLWKRTLRLLNGVARIFLGDRGARATVQAYHPFPALVVDPATREIQLIAKRIRKAARKQISKRLQVVGANDQKAPSIKSLVI
jgi:cellulose synthase/poly-beta-1,6-N-acetylglucosamine synthase-like glycosyltransferase